jgi:hypothetical protein
MLSHPHRPTAIFFGKPANFDSRRFEGADVETEQQAATDTATATGTGKARHLIIVSREHDFLYRYLLDRFSGDQNVEVILDRRKGDRRHKSGSWPGPNRRYGDRRKHPEIDEELRSRSHAILSRE